MTFVEASVDSMFGVIYGLHLRCTTSLPCPELPSVLGERKPGVLPRWQAPLVTPGSEKKEEDLRHRTEFCPAVLSFHKSLLGCQ